MLDVDIDKISKIINYFNIIKHKARFLEAIVQFPKIQAIKIILKYP